MTPQGEQQLPPVCVPVLEGPVLAGCEHVVRAFHKADLHAAELLHVNVGSVSGLWTFWSEGKHFVTWRMNGL